MRPRWDEGLWYLATLLYDQDHYTEARDAFRRFLAVKADVGPAWGLRGLCEFRLKEYDAALQSLMKGRSLGYGTNTAVQRAALSPSYPRSDAMAAERSKALVAGGW